ncbi:hemicentin-1-like [Echeneis naucrates]|uniref:hemicentin-1-like n=1 Tax=Echeneis naucrates TaxID=173247 RepID=UPI00111433BF|nr:hemicentin-1-like [Echeneis naucrates]
MNRRTSFVQLFVGFVLIETGVLCSCPIKLNPPMVVVKYGDPISINCSTSETHFEGMGWEAIKAGKSVQETSHLNWALTNVTDWDINPSCFINLKNSTLGQCDRIPKIVVYTFPRNIDINSVTNGVMKEGETHNLTCHIQHVAPVQNLTIRWYRGDTPVHIDTFNNQDRKPQNQTSVYTFTPTKDDNRIKFRCEAHMDLGPEGPELNVSSPEYHITVHFGPQVKCAGLALDVLEGGTLAHFCPVEGNPLPEVKWMKDGNPFDQDVPLSRADRGQYTIEAEGAGILKQKFQINVLYKPELRCPSSYTALEYTHHNLTCTAEGYPQPEIMWYKDGEEVELPEVLTRHDAGQYLVSASNSVSTVNATVDIKVEYPPSQILELEDSEVEVGSSVWLKCSSRGKPRPKYVWTYYRMDNVMEENEDGVARLLIHNATVYNTGAYTCQALNDRGNITKTAQVTVKGADQECPVEITPNSMLAHCKETPQTVTCKPTSSSKRHLKEIYWQHGDAKTSSGSLKIGSHGDWDRQPVCHASFFGLGRCSKALNFTFFKAPDEVFIRADKNSSLAAGQKLQLQCIVTEVAPARNVVVQWYHGNDTFEPTTTGSIQLIGCKNGKNCDINEIRCPITLISTITITLDRNHNGVEFKCKAQMDVGPRLPVEMISHPLNITVYYKPVINERKLPKVFPVFNGYPEELVCEADGQPPPEIQWSSDKGNHVPGATILVTKAGFYNCTATNEVDSVFHEIEVILKEDYLPLIAGFVAITVIAISVVFCFIYSIYYKNTKMRRYSLKNPKLSTQNGNVAHNGWDLQFPMTKLS